MTDIKQRTKEQHDAVIRCLIEGNFIRSTGRFTGSAKNMIQKLTQEMGEACLEFQAKALRNVKSHRIQVDEVWNFCYAKDKNLPDEMRDEPGAGSMCMWVALDAESGLNRAKFP